MLLSFVEFLLILIKFKFLGVLRRAVGQGTLLSARFQTVRFKNDPPLPASVMSFQILLQLYHLAQMPHLTRILYRPLLRSVVTQALLYKDCLPVQILPCFGSSKSSIRHNLSRIMSTNSTSPYEHFFHYTSGRWLWDEESQQCERFLVFNVQELQRIAAESVGAQSCVSITKLAEGGYNKVFRLVMDNGSVAIARIPNPNAGPAYKTTASEVATMDFVRCLYY